MKYGQMIKNTGFAIGYLVFSIFMVRVTDNFVSIWMGINVVFAMIPLVIIRFVAIRVKEKGNKYDWITIILLLVFLFFLPNTFYLITDFIHLTNVHGGIVPLIGYEADILLTNGYAVSKYFFILHVLFSALIGIYTGVESIRTVELLLKDKFSRPIAIQVFIVELLMLSAIGVYIGRFLRFFSWDILNPFRVLSEFITSFTWFSAGFIIVFSVVQIVLYYSYKLIILNNVIYKMEES